MYSFFLFCFSSMNTVRTECVAATSRSYNPDSSYTAVLGYYMTSQCFENGTDIDLTVKCESPSLVNFDETVPVTSVRTGTTYWNIYCAQCNSDADAILPWSASINFNQEFVFFGNMTTAWGYIHTFEDLLEKLAITQVIRYSPPIPMADKHCLQKKDLITCENSPIDINKPDWLFDSCHQFYNPIYATGQTITPYMNIFCLLCQEIALPTNNKTDCTMYWNEKASPGQMTALLDYKSVPRVTVTTDHDRKSVGGGKCSCNEVYDSHQVK